MDLHNQKRLKNMHEAEDRITNLPDALLHHILSFVKIKDVARTCVLSKRWNNIWTSFPTLDFLSLYHWPDSEENQEDPIDRTINSKISAGRRESPKETREFMAIVDRVLHLHDMSNIQKFCLRWRECLDVCRVNLWISGAIKRKVKELSLTVCPTETFCPFSIFTCETLITLELSVFFDGSTSYIPKHISLPNLKHLKLGGLKFSNEYELLSLSGCPVLEDLTLEYCEWVNLKNFCISAPSLKHLKIINDSYRPYYDYSYTVKRDLRNVCLKIDAPRLVSLTNKGSIAKDFVVSSPLTLVEANMNDVFPSYNCMYRVAVTKKQRVHLCPALIRFLTVLSHVKVLSIADHQILKALSCADDLRKVLPTFNNLKQLNLSAAENDCGALVALLRSAANLESLVFNKIVIYEDDDLYYGYYYGELDSMTTGCFPHLKSVDFKRFSGSQSEMWWVELILKKAKTLQTMTISVSPNRASESKEEIVAKVSSLFRASATSCELKFS